MKNVRFNHRKCRLKLLTTGSTLRNVALAQNVNKLPRRSRQGRNNGLRSGCFFCLVRLGAGSIMGNVALKQEKRRFGYPIGTQKDAGGLLDRPTPRGTY